MRLQHVFLVLVALRVRQWVKNVFVLAPLVFAQRLLSPDDTARTLLMLASFCAASSAIYIINDIFDRARDRLHPLKRLRPIASGQLPPTHAALAAFFLAAAGLSGGALAGKTSGVLVLCSYLLLNTAYSLRLKTIAYVDVLCIAAGFLLRIAAGAAAARVPVSVWILALTPVLAAYLGFGKRLHELLWVHETHSGARPTLGRYRPRTLRGILMVLEAVLPFLYLMYCLTTPGHALLAFNTPFLAAALHRFFKICTQSGNWESPTDRMLHDPLFLSFCAAWTAWTIWALYGNPPVTTGY